MSLWRRIRIEVVSLRVSLGLVQIIFIYRRIQVVFRVIGVDVEGVAACQVDELLAGVGYFRPEHPIFSDRIRRFERVIISCCNCLRICSS